MKRYIGKRLLLAAASMAAVLFILFLLMEFLPGSPFNDEKLSPAQLELLNAKYGLDQPFLLRFFRYGARMVQGDFGVSYSIAKDMPVRQLLAKRLWVSLKVGGLSVLAGGSLGIFLGTAAVVKNRCFRMFYSLAIVLGISIPSYVLALALSYLFGFRLGWFPLFYQEEKSLSSSVLPAAALGMFLMASTARMMCAGMTEVLESEYMAFAESRGIPEWRLLLVHGMRNALLPVTAVGAPMAAAVMTGSLAVEKIFSIPGAGSLMVAAIQENDYNVAAGLAFAYSGIYAVILLAADILYQLLDPRIRLT